MFDRELTIYAFLENYVKQVVGDLSDEAMKQPAFPGGNPPSWIVGHLSIAGDLGLKLLGKPTRLPKNWAVLFGPGSKPMEHLDRHPSRAELLKAYEESHAALTAAARDVDPARLPEPNPFTPLKGPLPTFGDMLTHLLTSHESFHVSQLSACRRAQGQPPLF